MGLFNRKKKDVAGIDLPEALMPEDPVNYNSVLDYLVGLSKADYSKMLKAVDTYREANKKVAGILGIKDEPVSVLSAEKPEISDEDLNKMLEAPKEALEVAFIDDGPVPPKPKKAQATEKKIEVKE